MSFVVNAVKDIAVAPVKAAVEIGQGKNVFESVGRAVGTSFASAPAVANNLTGGALGNAGIPLLSEGFKTSSDFISDPYSRANALALGRSGGKIGATVAGGLIAGPALGSAIGISTKAGTVLGGTLANQLASGKSVSSVLNNAATGLMPSLDGLLPDGFGEYAGDLKNLGSMLASENRAARDPFNLGAKNEFKLDTVKSGSNTILIIGVIGTLGYLYLKGKK